MKADKAQGTAEDREKEGSTESAKLVHLELIRFLAVCLVVFNHTDGYFLYFTTTDNPVTYLVSLFFSVLCRINVPLFFMVSGALLLKKQESIRDLYKKRVSRIVIVLVLCSALQYIGNGLSGQLDPDRGIWDFLKRLYTGNVIESYWFLYMYLAMLMGLPFFRRMAEGMTKAEFHYLFVLKMVFHVVLKTFGLGSGILLPLEIVLLTDAVFYLFAGYYMEYLFEERRATKQMPAKGTCAEKPKCCAAVPAVLAGGLVSVISMLTVYIGYCMTGTYSQDWLGIFTPILTIIVYYMVKSLCECKKMTETMQRAVVYLGSTAFGVYLIELPVRRQLLALYLYLCEHTVGLIACPVYVICSVALAVLYVSVLKRIPGIRKLL